MARLPTRHIRDYPTGLLTRRRRRRPTAPTAPAPTIMLVQLEGSGTSPKISIMGLRVTHAFWQSVCRLRRVAGAWAPPGSAAKAPRQRRGQTLVITPRPDPVTSAP